jgi:hypothetical protein
VVPEKADQSLVKLEKGQGKIQQRVGFTKKLRIRNA